MKSKHPSSAGSSPEPILPDTAPTSLVQAGPMHVRQADASFPIIGIGTSAGGLEALEQFLKHVPVASGMAIVIVQHLDPDHKGMLAEILKRSTPMAVYQVKNRMKIEPDCVYVIPPNKEMSIRHGALYLQPPTAPRGQRLPIDSFFTSLAEDQKNAGIGVILSGMGSDGTQGLRAIKAHGGLVAAQDPASAKFDSMPRSAITAEVADLVAVPAALPEKIMALLQHGAATSKVPASLGAHSSPLEEIVMHLRARTGRNFSGYKQSSLYRRIERRMGIHQIDRLAAYANYVRDNPQELDLLFKELLIGVTSFFRDPLVWKHLKEQEFPAIFAANPHGKTIRAWVAACSTGEEAYTLAITFREALEQVKPAGHFTLDIFATDLDPDAIARARQGIYPASIAAVVAPDQLRRFFIQEGSSYRISKQIREMVTFAPQDIILDSPFTRLDILSCRNLLIYFGTELHKKLLPLFHYALNPDGVLVLGSAETIGSFGNLFSSLDAKARIYRRIDPVVRAGAFEFPIGALPTPPTMLEKTKMQHPTVNLQTLADQILLQQFSPAAVLVNDKGDILYINGRTGKFLEPAAGKANWNIHAMAREELRSALAMALYEAPRKKDKVVVHGVHIGGDTDGQSIDISVQQISKPPALEGMLMVAFTEIPAPPPRQEMPVDAAAAPLTEVVELEQALKQALEENHAIREQMQSAREELRSANEELQSNNEELQSTNEELTSSREEMQSMNEELQTINAELQSKIEDLSRTSDDMKNLLDSTDIATIFLDNSLNVRRFTNRTTQIFKLIQGDIGRPLSDIVSDLRYPELQADAHQVLSSLVFTDKQIPTSDGRWFKVRIMPYRTQDNVIDGVVITLSDITAAKILEAQLRQEIAAPEVQKLPEID